MSRKYVQIRHSASDSLIAEGPLAWGITPFEGNYYISSKYLLTDGFRGTRLGDADHYRLAAKLIRQTKSNEIIPQLRPYP